MDEKRLNKILEAPPCRDDMSELVMAFAEGLIGSEAERERVMAHMAACDSCRYLFEDYYLYEEALAETAADETTRLPSVAFAVASGAVRPAASPYLDSGARAHVLGDSDAPVADYRLPMRRGELPFRVIATERGATLEVRAVDDSAKYYLIGKRGYTVARVYDGFAVFERVGPGEYLLSENLNGFVGISIKD
ncbi:MAG TPA: zf-HC2 domain-containing protein [Spirochaetota bacterium]|nr:zf-HC2 domain-containing protein [Spirochaetota bacterium]